jgi:hypothetical protein
MTRVIACCVMLSTLTGCASAAEPVVLSSFEPDGVALVRHEGTVVAEGASDGKHACRLESDEKEYRAIEVLPEALARFKDHRWLKADLYNPGEKGVSYGVRVDDAKSRDYGSRANFDGLFAPPGRSEVRVDMRWLPRGTRGDTRLDLDALRLVKVFLGPSKEKSVLFIDNVRLEGSPDDAPVETVLFDFEDDADLAAWSQDAADKEPPVKLALVAEGATSGRRALKLTYAGGRLPAVRSSHVPVDDWTCRPALKADVTAPRDCLAVFRVLRESGDRKTSWAKLARLRPGRNEVVELTFGEMSAFASQGKVVGIEIAMYEPREGESIVVDNVRLVDSRPKEISPYRYYNPVTAGGMTIVGHPYPFFPRPGKFKVLGSDVEVRDADELAASLKSSWKMPERKTLDEIGAAFRARFDELKKTHPAAVCVTLREGDKGCDPADPAKVFAGWQDVYMQGHDPAPAYIASELGARRGGRDEIEMFLRRRAALFRVDLSSIPKGSKVLAAELILVKTKKPEPPVEGKDPGAWSPFKPAFVVAEPCRRAWVESEADGIEYAKGKFWNELCGMDWTGPDPDFEPLFIACGQAGWDVNVVDFTEAVRRWTEGGHENHGWVMCSPLGAMEYQQVFSREAAEVKNRPALMVIYEPATANNARGD